MAEDTRFRDLLGENMAGAALSRRRWASTSTSFARSFVDDLAEEPKTQGKAWSYRGIRAAPASARRSMASTVYVTELFATGKKRVLDRIRMIAAADGDKNAIRAARPKPAKAGLAAEAADSRMTIGTNRPITELRGLLGVLFAGACEARHADFALHRHRARRVAPCRCVAAVTTGPAWLGGVAADRRLWSGLDRALLYREEPSRDLHLSFVVADLGLPYGQYHMAHRDGSSEELRKGRRRHLTPLTAY